LRDPRKFLCDVSVDEIFRACDGRTVRNLYELLHLLEEISTHGFEYHVSRDRDDFLKWIEQSVNDKELAKRLKNTRNTRKEYIEVVGKRIKELEKKSRVINVTRFFGKKTKEETQKYAHFLLTISFIVLICLVIFLGMVQVHSLYVMDQLSFQLREYQEKSSIFDNYLSQELRRTQLLINNSVPLNQTISQENASPIIFNENVFPPPDHVKEGSIEVLEDRVIIYVNSPLWARFAPSGSMLPVISENANSIEIKPEKTSDIRIGDIISFKTWQGNVIVHRVISIGKDEEGWYAVTKGDNLAFADPLKVRFDQVQSVVVAVIY